MASHRSDSADVLIIGSGPNGASAARLLVEQCPAARVLVVEAGPQLTEVPGLHVKNIPDPLDRSRAQIASEGPLAAGKQPTTTPVIPRDVEEVTARPGTELIDPERANQPGAHTLPAAAMSTDVGGMGVHWTCACPHPYGRERIPFIAEREWEDLLDAARTLLAVTQHAFPRSRAGEAVLRTLARELDAELPEGRKVQNMPLACRVLEDGTRHWTGSDVVLDWLITDPPVGFELRSQTLCRRIRYDGDRVTGAELEDRRSGERYGVSAQVVIVAADSFRTPQLLWASGIRPRALGHYLNDHVQVMGAVRLDESHVERMTADLDDSAFPDAPRGADQMVGVFWVPYADDAHPFHSQVMHWDMSPLSLERPSDLSYHSVGAGALFGKADIRFEDCVTFSDTELDPYGMPKMRIDYSFTERDLARIESVRAHQDRQAAAFGSYAPGREPRVMPPGSSLHYMGSFRMSEADEGESVCDPYGRVWGFRNLYVSGNGTIPTETAGNSTLTSVAITVRTARAIAAELHPRAAAARPFRPDRPRASVNR